MNRLIDIILKTGTAVSFSLLIFVVLLQVITRLYPGINSPSWTEEASRLLFIYSIGFAAPLAVKNSEYVRVDYFLDKMPLPKRKAVELIMAGGLTVFFFFLFYQSVVYVSYNTFQTLPILRVKIMYSYLTLPFLTFFMSYFYLMEFIKGLRGEKC